MTLLPFPVMTEKSIVTLPPSDRFLFFIFIYYYLCYLVIFELHLLPFAQCRLCFDLMACTYAVRFTCGKALGLGLGGYWAFLLYLLFLFIFYSLRLYLCLVLSVRPTVLNVFCKLYNLVWHVHLSRNSITMNSFLPKWRNLRD